MCVREIDGKVYEMGVYDVVCERIGCINVCERDECLRVGTRMCIGDGVCVCVHVCVCVIRGCV